MDFKNFLFGQRRTTFKIGAKEGIGDEDITSTKEMLNTFHRDNRKDVLRASQQWAIPYPCQTQGCESETHLKDHRAPCSYSGAQGVVSSRFSLLCSATQVLHSWFKWAWPLLQLEADLSIIYLVLVLQGCRVLELVVQRGFHKNL